MLDITQFAAGVVLYNPELERLKENIEAIAPQVHVVYCFNNGVKNEKAIKDMLSSYSNVLIIGEGKNLGIATALNRLIEQADKDGIEWLLTLDQDSVVSCNMIEKMSSLTKNENAAIICPLVEDVRRKNEKPVQSNKSIEDVDFCITSGSLMNVKTTLKVGGFDDYLFIGLVDDEICYRIKINGYRIIRNNDVVLNHELGNLIPSKHEKLWLTLGKISHCKSIEKLSYKREVSPMRLYYATRNMVYLREKYKDYTGEAYWNKRICVNSLSSYVRSGFRLNVLKAIVDGYNKGKLKVTSEYTFK